MHPANCSSRQIYLNPKNLQILCYYASKPKFSYVATYFESFSPFFFRREKRSCCNNKLLATRQNQQGQEGHKFAYLAKQYFASLHEQERFRNLPVLPYRRRKMTCFAGEKEKMLLVVRKCNNREIFGRLLPTKKKNSGNSCAVNFSASLPKRKRKWSGLNCMFEF